MVELPLSYVDKQEADAEWVRLMNTYSQNKTPFLFIINFDKKEPIVIPLDDAGGASILYDINGFTNCNYNVFKDDNKDFVFEKFPITFSDYKLKFDLVQQHLKQGNSYL